MINLLNVNMPTYPINFQLKWLFLIKSFDIETLTNHFNSKSFMKIINDCNLIVTFTINFDSKMDSL